MSGDAGNRFVQIAVAGALALSAAAFLYSGPATTVSAQDAMSSAAHMSEGTIALAIAPDLLVILTDSTAAAPKVTPKKPVAPKPGEEEAAAEEPEPAAKSKVILLYKVDNRSLSLVAVRSIKYDQQIPLVYPATSPSPTPMDLRNAINKNK